MSVRTTDIFGQKRGERAQPGTYGMQPRGYRLPDATRLGRVRLRVADLARSIAYYESVLGMAVLERTNESATLGAHGSNRALVELHELSGARPFPRRGRLGLFHFAILLPDRISLGAFVRHLAEQGVRAGAADHLVSEAFYLTDPDGLGIEVYADRPRETWQRVGRELMMSTDPIDMNDLLEASGGVQWEGMPAGTVMGHVHLHVGGLDAASAFFSEAMGFDRTVWSYPGALFLAADGYHHHLGTNLWAGAEATPTGPNDAGLLEWTLELPDAADVDAVAKNLGAAGHSVTREGADVLTTDPWKTGIRVRRAED